MARVVSVLSFLADSRTVRMRDPHRGYCATGKPIFFHHSEPRLSPSAFIINSIQNIHCNLSANLSKRFMRNIRWQGRRKLKLGFRYVSFI